MRNRQRGYRKMRRQLRRAREKRNRTCSKRKRRRRVTPSNKDGCLIDRGNERVARRTQGSNADDSPSVHFLCFTFPPSSLFSYKSRSCTGRRIGDAWLWRRSGGLPAWRGGAFRDHTYDQIL